MVMYVIWLILCFLMGWFAGGIGLDLVESFALAANDAFFLGWVVGAIVVIVLVFMRYIMAKYIDD